MKRFLGLLFVLAMVFPAVGQSSQKRYVSRMTPDGVIFFVNPLKLGSLTNIKRFEYDMTLLNWTDSVTVNFTIESSKMQAPKDLRILSGDKIYECKEFSVLFIDIKKNHYEIRVSSKFLVSNLTEILKTSVPPAFSFTQDGILGQAAYKESEWKKERKKLSDIFQLYLYSKK